MRNFVKVSYKFYDRDEVIGMSMFHKIGTQGFTIYHSLLFMQGSNFILTTSIKLIKDFCNIDGLQDKRIVLNYLLALKRNNLIECKQLNNKTRLNDTLMIKIIQYEEKGFSQISCELIYDKLSKIGHIGFSIYCLLHKNHNLNFGDTINPTNTGFANPTREYIADILNISIDSVKKYVRILEKQRLIKIEEQPKIPYISPNGEEKWKQAPNHYIVRAKCEVENKYYIGKDKI